MRIHKGHICPSPKYLCSLLLVPDVSLKVTEMFNVTHNQSDRQLPIGISKDSALVLGTCCLQKVFNGFLSIYVSTYLEYPHI